MHPLAPLAPLVNLGLTQGATYDLNGRRAVFDRAQGDGMLAFSDANTGAFVTLVDPISGQRRLLDTEAVMEMMRAGAFTKVGEFANLKDLARLNRPEFDPEEITARDPKARMRLFLVRELLERGTLCSDPAISKDISEIWTEEVAARFGPRPPIPTVRKWLSKASKLSTVRLIDMTSMSGRMPRKPSEKKLNPTMRAFVEEGARYFYTERGLREVDVCAYVESKRVTENERRQSEEPGLPLLAPVSRSTIRRAINAIEAYETVAEKMGEPYAKRRWAVSGQPFTSQRLLQIGFIDDKVMDNICVFSADNRMPVGRPWICVILDLHTRCILGWYLDFQAPTTHSALETFKRACLPKKVRDQWLYDRPVLASIFGRESIIVADNGKNYTTPSFEDALIDTGTALQLAGVGTPTAKSMLERFFRTLDTILAQKLPGYTIDIKLARELKYDPTKDAVLTLAELEDLVEEAVYFYHINNHSGLGMPPARKWELSMEKHGITLLDDPRALDQYMGETFNCRLTKNGFNIEGIWFRDREIVAQLADDLAGLEKAGTKLKSTFAASIKVRLNTANLTEAHVWNHRTNKYVAVPAANQEYVASLSLYQHKQIKAWAKEQGRAFISQSEQLLARDELNQRIRETVPDLELKQRKAMVRMMSYTAVQRAQSPIPVVHTEQRHDGRGAIIETTAFAHDRVNADTLPDRPAPKVLKPASQLPFEPEGVASIPGPDDFWDDEFAIPDEGAE